MAVFVNYRRQHAVGQGFFHSSHLFEESELRLRFVYDCGAMAMYADARDARIDELLGVVGPGTRLDILFLSHVHADHINGVTRLLDPASGLRVDTIVLPLVNVADRLIAYARTMVEDPGAAADDFYRDFVANPAAALSRFEPRQILFIEGGRGDGGGAPGSHGPGGDDPERGRARWSEGPVDGKRWTLVGEGQVRWPGPDVVPAPTLENAGAPMVCVVPHTMGLIIPYDGGEWLLAPFVDPTVELQRRKFLVRLAKALKMTRARLEVWLDTPANLETLVKTGAGTLATTYGAVAKDLNVTSLCLYSGPVPRVANDEQRGHRAKLGGFTYGNDGLGVPIAWLGTGDAALAKKSRLDAMLGHYGALLAQVGTLTIPHHGSDHNFNSALLTGVAPTICVAAADRYSNWRHPGSKVVQGVASQGLPLQVVTSSPLSEMEEWATIG
jgi:hypothetical protein